MTIGYLYDFVFLLVFAWTAVHSWRRGLLASLTELAGAVAGFAGGIWACRTLAPQIYSRYLSGAVSAQVEKAIADAGGDAAAALQTLDFLPETLRASLANLLTETTADFPQQVATALEPVLLPLIQLILFIVSCLLLRWLFRLLVGMLRHVNDLPLVGWLNRLLGLGLGIITGLLNCWLVALALWLAATITMGKLDWLTTGALGQSVGYTFFSAFNPFLVYY